jgi:hypothetical protein
LKTKGLIRLTVKVAPISVIFEKSSFTEFNKIGLDFFSDFFGFKWSKVSPGDELGLIVLIISDNFTKKIIEAYKPSDFENRLVLWIMGNAEVLLQQRPRFTFYHQWAKSVLGQSGWFFYINKPNLKIITPMMIIPSNKNTLQIDNRVYLDLFNSSFVFFIDFPVFIYLSKLLKGIQSKLRTSDELHTSYLPLTPIFDMFMDFIWKIWTQYGKEQNLPVLKLKKWPESVQWMTVLSHDIDHLHFRSRFAPIRYWISRFLDGQWPDISYLKDALLHLGGIKNIGWGIDDILAIESRKNIRSTFFILREVMNDKAIRILRKVAKNGWDVELHPHPKEVVDREKLESSLKWLENTISTTRNGVRNHYLTYNYPETWNTQNLLNLSYDSSLGFRKIFGCRTGTSQPYRTGFGDLIEIPMIGMDTFWDISDGSGWFHGWKGQRKNEGRSHILSMLQLISKVEGVFTLNWHNARYRLPYRRDYPKIIDTAKQLGSSFWSYRKISNWWKDRSEFLQSVSINQKKIKFNWKEITHSNTLVIQGFFPSDWDFQGNFELLPLKERENINYLAEYRLIMENNR